MWVDRVLKCPDQGAWVALTRVDAAGSTHPLGYVSLPFREEATQALKAALHRRADERERVHPTFDDFTAAELVDLVLAEMHPDLPASIDADPERPQDAPRRENPHA